MLVNDRVYPWGNQRPVLWHNALGNRAAVHDPRQLDLVLDGAVLVQIPEKAVVIVPDRREKREHQTTRAPGLHLVRPPVRVLPQNAIVLLVHAHGIWQRYCLAPSIGHDGVKIVNVAQAIAAQPQGVRQHPKAVLTLVKHILAIMGWGRISIGNNHLRHRCAIEDWAHPSLILIAKGVEHKALPGRPADSQVPLLPGYLVSIDLEAWSVRLSDLERLEVRPQLSNSLRGVVPGRRRYRHDTIILHPDNLHGPQIHEYDHSLDGVGVAIVMRGVADENNRARESSPGRIVFRTIIPGRPGLNHDQTHVCDPSPGKDGLKLRILFHQIFHLQDFLKGD